jgi:hypothetical protein
VNGTTPAKIEKDVQAAWQDVLMEFARCSGVLPEGDVLAKIEKLFEDTIENGIRNHGAGWDEPIRSYALKHVCKIAKRSACDCDVSADDLVSTTTIVIEDARKTCTKLAKSNKMKADEIGILCEE